MLYCTSAVTVDELQQWGIHSADVHDPVDKVLSDFETDRADSAAQQAASALRPTNNLQQLRSDCKWDINIPSTVRAIGIN